MTSTPIKLAKERERCWRVLERATEAVGRAVQKKREAKIAYDLALAAVVTYKEERGGGQP
jgi:hypothetical protein